MRFDKARVRQMFFERTQNRIEPFNVTYLKDEAAARRHVRELGSMCRIVSDRYLDQHMFALGQESAYDLVMSIGGRCHGSGVNHRSEISKRFGRCGSELARNGATPGRLHVIYHGELSKRNFRVE